MMNPNLFYKRDQVGRAIAGITRRQREDGAPDPGLKADMKRLLDLDRELVLEEASDSNARYAFYDGPPPGQGGEIAYTAYNAFALLIALRLLDSGLKQSAALRFMRGVRSELEAEFNRISAISPQHIHPGLTDADLNNRLAHGFLTGSADRMSFLVPIASNDPLPIYAHSAPENTYFGNVCSSVPTLLQRLEYFSHKGRAAVVIELLNPAHQLRYRLDRIPVRKRGRS
jgi:hypothetical protein